MRDSVVDKCLRLWTKRFYGHLGVSAVGEKCLILLWKNAFVGIAFLLWFGHLRPEDESSRGQQRSATDLPPLSEWTKASQKHFLLGCLLSTPDSVAGLCPNFQVMSWKVR